MRDWVFLRTLKSTRIDGKVWKIMVPFTGEFQQWRFLPWGTYYIVKGTMMQNKRAMPWAAEHLGVDKQPMLNG